MAKPITLYPSQHTAVGPNLPLARAFWSEPPASGGVATVRDGNGLVLATITYLGRNKGPEPGPVVFNPPLTVTAGAIHVSAPGGWLQVYIGGSSSSGG